jgi:TIR domain
MADQPHRVFLSHSGKDKDFVRELYRRLTRDGVSCFFDIESIGWGHTWVRALEQALDRCEFVVFVLSPDFCNSEWVEVERTSSIADDPATLKRKVLPLMLRPCRDLPNFPRFLRQFQAIDISTPENFEKNYPRICQELGGVVHEDSVPSDRTKLPPVHRCQRDIACRTVRCSRSLLGGWTHSGTFMIVSSAMAPQSWRAKPLLSVREVWGRHSLPLNMHIGLDLFTPAASIGLTPIRDYPPHLANRRGRRHRIGYEGG